MIWVLSFSSSSSTFSSEEVAEATSTSASMVVPFFSVWGGTSPVFPLPLDFPEKHELYLVKLKYIPVTGLAFNTLNYFLL